MSERATHGLEGVLVLETADWLKEAGINIKHILPRDPRRLTQFGQRKKNNTSIKQTRQSKRGLWEYRRLTQKPFQNGLPRPSLHRPASERCLVGRVAPAEGQRCMEFGTGTSRAETHGETKEASMLKAHLGLPAHPNFQGVRSNKHGQRHMWWGLKCETRK